MFARIALAPPIAIWASVPGVSDRSATASRVASETQVRVGPDGALAGVPSIGSSVRPPGPPTPRGSGGAATPSTSTRTTSGAASSMACSIASLTVTDEDGQPLQLPASRSRTTPSSSTPEQVDVAGVRAEIGPYPFQRRRDPLERAGRMQIVQDEQAGHDLVGRRPSQDVVAVRAVRSGVPPAGRDRRRRTRPACVPDPSARPAITGSAANEPQQAVDARGRTGRVDVWHCRPSGGCGRSWAVHRMCRPGSR